MAVFKLLQGSAEDLELLKATEGYAYFTPDDGKFYIDIADSTGPATVGSRKGNGVNRICINAGGGVSDHIILDAGAFSNEIGSNVRIYDCEIPAGTPEDSVIVLECN